LKLDRKLFIILTTKDKEKGLEKLDLFGSVNTKEARNTALELIKKKCLVWNSGQNTKQIRLDNGERARAYICHPYIIRKL
tara:strand:+ start:804 stop:1043 length:240 start_codon:yes stop_codon:yes gene_type:complete